MPAFGTAFVSVWAAASGRYARELHNRWGEALSVSVLLSVLLLVAGVALNILAVHEAKPQMIADRSVRVAKTLIAASAACLSLLLIAYWVGGWHDIHEAGTL